MQINTSLKLLMEQKDKYIKANNKEPLFISGWDISKQEVILPDIIIEKSLINSKNNIEKYTFSSDLSMKKNELVNFFKSISKTNLNSENLAICSNGTNSIYLSIISLLASENINTYLIITPMYFSTLEVLKILGCKIVFYYLKESNLNHIDYKNIELLINKHNVQAIILTDPIFGIGIEIENRKYDELVNICNKHSTWLIVDYIYGGMEWDSKSNKLLNIGKINIINGAEKYIFIESISKRLFINGNKIALIFASKNIVPTIELYSEYFTGPFCYSQIALLNEIYSHKNYSYILSVINKNLKNIINNYIMIKKLLIKTNIIISNCNTSYFCQIGIPKNNFAEENDIKIAIKILYDTGILTIPHSRYLFSSNQYYNFRVNLTLEKEKLKKAILTAINFYK